MDFCRNVSVPSGLQPPEQHFPSTLDDLLSGHHTEEGDLNMEWLSIFVEDCLSSSGNCLPPALAVLPSGATPTAPCTTPAVARNTSPTTPLGNSLPLDKFAVPGKARSKRKRTPNLQKTPFRRTNCWYRPPPQGEDPPLLQQVHWLADSELIQLPEYKKKGGKCGKSSRGMKEEGSGGSNNGHGQLGMRRCSHCLSQRTPQWRAGPLGPKTLCNACGVRYKSGRLLPEYRPAKSPTFVSHKHSNSHKKVLEMRMSLLSSPPNSNSLL